MTSKTAVPSSWRQDPDGAAAGANADGSRRKVAVTVPACSPTHAQRRGTPGAGRCPSADSHNGPSPAMSKADRRLEGWSIIARITPFVHAVGRVSDGRGSAILVALPEKQDARWSAAALASSRSTRLSLSRMQPRTASDASPGGRRLTAGCTAVGGEGSAVEGRSDETPVAVLLTTSAVLGSRREALTAHVTFMEQPVAGTGAQMGRQPQPFTVAVRGDVGFVCSAESSSRSLGGGGASREGVDWGSISPQQAPLDRASGGSGSGSQPHSRVASHASGADEEDEEDTEEGEESDADAVEIGYSLTYCEVEPRPGLPHAGGGGSRGVGGWRSSAHAAQRFDGSGGWSTSERGSTSTTTTTTTNTAAATRGSVHSAGSRASTGIGLKTHTRDTVYLIKPLPLPLLLSAIGPVRPGDTHLTVTHIDGGARRYVVQHVEAVFEDFCVYADDATLPGDYWSGGPVFNMSGDFIGLQHRDGPQSLCMFTASIVKNLFHANRLGICRPPISDHLAGETGEFGQSVVTTSDHVPAEIFNLPFSFTQQSSVMDVGVEGDRLIDFSDLERVREYRERPVPLTERKPTAEEVYREFYSGFDSLTHMLNAFYYCPALTTRILETMVSAQYSRELQMVAASGGVGMVLVVMDCYPEIESLVATSLSALSRMCLHRHNLIAFVRLDGAATVLEIMKEHPHAPQVLQWAAYCLAHVTEAGAPSLEETVDFLLRCSVVELAVSSLRAHGRAEGHLTRWLCVLLANMAAVRPRAVTLYVHEGLPQVALVLTAHHTEDQPLTALLLLLARVLQILADELPDFSRLETEAEGMRAAAADDDSHAREVMREFEELRDFICTSPLSVSAYFMYCALAEQPTAAPAVSVDGTSTVEGPPGAASRSPTTGTVAASSATTPEGLWHGTHVEGTPLPSSAASSYWSAAAAVAGRIPTTPLNGVLMYMLDRESRKKRTNASVELIGVCLDVMQVLDAWCLFPVEYVEGSPTQVPAEYQPLLSEMPSVEDGPSIVNEERFLTARAAEDAHVMPGTARAVQASLDRIMANYWPSSEIVARVRAFVVSENE